MIFQSPLATCQPERLEKLSETNVCEKAASDAERKSARRTTLKPFIDGPPVTLLNQKVWRFYFIGPLCIP
jgi:hypothetical protein